MRYLKKCVYWILVAFKAVVLGADRDTVLCVLVFCVLVVCYGIDNP